MHRGLLLHRRHLPRQKVELRGACHRAGGGAWLTGAGRRGGVAVDVDTEVLAGEDNGSVIGKCYIKALGVFHAAFQSRHEPSVGREECCVEVVVVVGHQDAAHRVNADTNRIVCDTLATNLAQKCTVIAKHLFQTLHAHNYKSIIAVMKTTIIAMISDLTQSEVTTYDL